MELVPKRDEAAPQPVKPKLQLTVIVLPNDEVVVHGPIDAERACIHYLTKAIDAIMVHHANKEQSRIQVMPSASLDAIPPVRPLNGKQR